MARFGRAKKKAAKAEKVVADLNVHVADVPRVHLPHVDTSLNINQYNGFMDVNSLEQQNGSVAAEAPTETTLPQTPNPPNGDSSNTEWSSAVGHAATGKSGRVIHNLQEEIARLTRECSFQRSRADEAQRTNETLKEQLQNTVDRLRNLEQANEANLNSIVRKDKKIEELRAEILTEKDRRQQAEGDTRKIHQLMAESRDDFNRKCAELQEIANHARTQYDVLAKAEQRERGELQKKFKAIRDEFLALKAENDKKDVQLERLDAVMAQKNREIETSKENFERLFEEYESYKNEHDQNVRAMIENGHEREAKFDAALASLKETQDQMRWVMQVKKEIKGSE